MTGVWLLVAVLTASTIFGLTWRRRTGRLRRTRGHDGDRLTRAELAALGVTPGPRATLVEFSTAFCAPCRATRRILTEVAGMVDGVHFHEVDAEAHLSAVRRLHILRTPTTLVLAPDGRIVVRASGQPRKADVIAALGALDA